MSETPKTNQLLSIYEDQYFLYPNPSTSTKDFTFVNSAVSQDQLFFKSVKFAQIQLYFKVQNKYLPSPQKAGPCIYAHECISSENKCT